MSMLIRKTGAWEGGPGSDLVYRQVVVVRGAYSSHPNIFALLPVEWNVENISHGG